MIGSDGNALPKKLVRTVKRATEIEVLALSLIDRHRTTISELTVALHEVIAIRERVRQRTVTADDCERLGRLQYTVQAGDWRQR